MSNRGIRGRGHQAVPCKQPGMRRARGCHQLCPAEACAAAQLAGCEPLAAHWRAGTTVLLLAGTPPGTHPGSPMHRPEPTSRVSVPQHRVLAVHGAPRARTWRPGWQERGRQLGRLGGRRGMHAPAALVQCTAGCHRASQLHTHGGAGLQVQRPRRPSWQVVPQRHARPQRPQSTSVRKKSGARHHPLHQ